MRSILVVLVLSTGCEPDPVVLDGPSSSVDPTVDPPDPTSPDPQTGAFPTTLQTDSFPNGIAADADHIYVVIGEPHSGPDSFPIGIGTTSAVQVFSAVDGLLVDEIEVPGGGHSLVMSPDGGTLYVAHFSLDNQVTAISTDTLAVVAEVGGPLQLDIVVPDALSISPDGRWVYVGNNGLFSGWISRIDTETHEVDGSWRATVEGGFTCWVAASPDPERLYANSWTGGTVQLKDAVDGTSITSAQVGAFPHALAMEPTGQFIYAMVSGGNRVLKLDAATLDVVTEIDGPTLGFWGGPVSGVMSHEARHLFVANHVLGNIAVVDVDPDSPTYDTVVETLDAGADPIFSALSPDGERLYVANNAGSTITVLDVSAWP